MRFLFRYRKEFYLMDEKDIEDNSKVTALWMWIFEFLYTWNRNSQHLFRNVYF